MVGPRRKSKKSFFKPLLKWFALMCIWGALFLSGIVLWFGSELPDIEELSKLPRHPSILVFDNRNQILASYGDLYGNPIRAEELPPHVVNALLAIEDRRFYHHWGIDPIGMVRAFKRNMEAGGVVQGGSTITQQLAKNFLQSKKIYSYQDRSLKRKISEAILAFRIERKFTKNQILTMHLNRVYMGSGTWGIDAAAMRYFGKHAKELGLYESSVLMGLLKAPSRYSPASNHERSEGRAQQVLQAMVEAGFISQEAAVAAMAMPVPLAMNTQKHSARYFTDWITEQLPELIDTGSEDLEVFTTLDLPMQRIAERRAVEIMKSKGAQWGAQQIALVSMNPEGAVKAMVGGTQYKGSPFNRATRSLRQAGSTFKYFVFLTALEEGYTPGSVVDDTPVVIGDWKPKNFRHKARGGMSLREALARSVNAVSIRLAMDVGVSKVISMARRLGISSPLPRNLTLALGTGGVTLLEMTGAFAAVAHEGHKVKPYGIRMVRNRKGQVLYQHKSMASEQVIDDESLEEMKEMLEGVVDYGSGRLAKIPSVPIMGKTGTSNKGKDDRDLWFIAMTENLVTGVWSGCDDEKAMPHQNGGSPALHLWREYNSDVIRYMKNPSLPEWELESSDAPVSVEKPVSPEKNQKPQNQQKEEEEDDDDDDDEEDEEDSDDEADGDKSNDQGSSHKEKSVPPPKTNYEDPEARKQLIREILDHMGN